MSTVLWVKLGSKGSSRVPCEKRVIGFRVLGEQHAKISGPRVIGSMALGS